MRLTNDQIGHISRQIVRGLMRSNMLVTEQPEEVTDSLVQIFTENLLAEDKLNDEVRNILQNYSDEINRGMVNYQDLFRKVKTKLARERKMVI